MVTKLDTFLSWAVPILVILIFAALVYSKVPAPFDTLLNWFRNIWEKMTDSGSSGEYQTVLRYEQN